MAEAIAETIERNQGKRTDLATSVEFQTEVQKDRPDEIAARKAGLGSKDTLRAAQKVIERDIPELVEAMDRGKVTRLSRVKRYTAVTATPCNATSRTVTHLSRDVTACHAMSRHVTLEVPSLLVHAQPIWLQATNQIGCSAWAMPCTVLAPCLHRATSILVAR